MQTTVLLFIACAITGNILALPIAFGRLSKRRWIKIPVTAFVLLFRGTPLLVQLYIVYFGVGQVLASVPSIRFSPVWPLFRSAYSYAFFALALNTAAYCGEIWRGAIMSVPRGQSEAGWSLGLSNLRIMKTVILPQALRLALPSIGGQNILLLKGTALAAAITVFELMAAANFVRAQTFRVYEPLLAAALAYFVLSLFITSGFKVLENRLAARY